MQPVPTRLSVLLAAGLLLFSCSRQPSDETIANELKAKLFADPWLRTAQLTVMVRHAEVTLSGRVETPEMQLKAFKLAYVTHGVRGIRDEMYVIPERTSQALETLALPRVARPVENTTPPASSHPAQPYPPAETPVEVAQGNAVASPKPAPPRQAAKVGSPLFARRMYPLPVTPDVPATDVPVAVVAVAPAPVPAASPSFELRAAGDRADANAFLYWFSQLERGNPSIHGQYQTLRQIDSVRLLSEGAVDFVAAEIPPTRDQAARIPDLHQLPVLINAVVPVYNLPGVTKPVNFTPQALARIYLGKITRWNDPELVAVNPSLNLPSAAIAVVTTRDLSWMTYVWTDYLSRVSPEWRSGPGAGATVVWPVAIYSTRNEMVASFVRGAPYSIGFADYPSARRGGLQSGAIRNSSGRFVTPNEETIAASAVPPFKESIGGQISIANSSNPQAYPITAFSWLLVPGSMISESKRKAFGTMITYVLTQGEQPIRSLAYVPLPKPLADAELQWLRETSSLSETF